MAADESLFLEKGNINGVDTEPYQSWFSGTRHNLLGVGGAFALIP